MKPKVRASLWVWVTTGSLVLSGCAGLLPKLEADDVVTERSTMEDYLAQEISWGPCAEDWLVEPVVASSANAEAILECSTVFVPGVYDLSPDVPEFGIAMMRLRPVGEDVPDKAIFINPGGPGGSGIEQVQISDFPAELRESFSFIGFDPRGVGQSTFADGTAIKCSDELDFISYFSDSSPATEAEHDALIEQSDAYYLDCKEQNPYWWTLSTKAVVEDLELMRRVVTPDEPLNFIGSSYGTTIAGRYVSEYPDGVGKIVFDSPTTVDTDRIASGLKDWEAAEEKLRIYVQGYADHLGVSFQSAWDRVLEIRERAASGLLVGYAGFEPSPTSPDSMMSSEALFTRGIFTLNYFPEADAVSFFIQGITDAYDYNWNGSFEWLAFYLDGYDADSLDGASLQEKNIVRSNEYEIRVMVNSMDLSIPPLSEDEQRTLDATYRDTAPLWYELSNDPDGYQYFGPPKGLSWSRIALDDPAIPDPPSTPFIPSNPSGKQLLIIGSLYESVTPFSFAKDTAELLSSALVSVDSDVHAPAAGYKNECVNRVLVQYFLGDAPVTDTAC